MKFKGLVSAAALGIALAFSQSVHAQERGAIGEILDREQLVLMNNLAAAPWQFRDANGNPAGFSVDLNRMIAARLGVPLHMIDTDWVGLIPGLLAEKSDFIASSMTTTFPRAQQVLFTTEAWYQTGVVAFVKPDAEKNWESLNAAGKKVAVVGGSAAVDVAKRFFANAEVQSYTSDVDTYQALQAGRVDAVLGDQAVAKTLSKNYGFVAATEPRELISTDNWAFAVRPGDNFTWQYLNYFLTSIKQNGELEALRKYWVDGDQWQKDFQEKGATVSKERVDLVNFVGIQEYVPETKGSKMTLE